MQVVLLFCGAFSLAASFRNFVISTDVRTGERRFRDLTVITAPDDIGRVRLLLSTAKAMSMGSTFDVFHLRLRWTEPAYWNDDFDDSGRHYIVQCAIQDTQTKEKRILIDMRVDWSFNGYDEKFRLPDRDLLLRCRICAINSEAIRSRWTNSRAVYISRTQAHRLDGNTIHKWSIGYVKILMLLSVRAIEERHLLGNTQRTAHAIPLSYCSVLLRSTSAILASFMRTSPTTFAARS